ncbi:flagellar hook-associated protein 1 [Compostibacillus humi]|uniref:Flagellar hook-associated protein 1 n=1 Tax=Compostibacillus humi TaxID=1245525 RepID=A0A8J2ZSB3_9BACI|nr:flagellar hook-associated protein FlgK [Compostibacillus humi]GGH75408.1 flagellar hook-associated protein 1 [Compostibacillus humi]
MSTFRGLEMAKQALFAQQSALYTTGHNIANANTEGYSRQRVNFETATPYPAGSRNRPQIPGQIGTGVEVGDIQRIRDQYLDMQFRGENSKVGYWETRAGALARMENLLNEPSDSGLSAVLDQFWQSLQDLSVNPENSGARSVVVERGQALAETFNYLSDSLHAIRKDLQQEIDVTIKDVNSLLKQIHNINVQVSELEPHGYVANDLYDRRDKLIDELSSIMNIKVTRVPSGGGAKEIAYGKVTIELLDRNGKETGIVLVDGNDLQYGKLQEVIDGNPMKAVSSIQLEMYNKDNEAVGTINSILDQVLESNGSLRALIEAYGYGTTAEDGYPAGDFPEMMKQLDKLAYEFAKAFNKVHSQGYDLDGAQNDLDFFIIGIDENAPSDYFGFASGIKVHHEFIENPEKIQAGYSNPEDENDDNSTGDDEHSSSNGAGNGLNAKRLADIILNGLTDDEGTTESIKSSFESIIGELGVDTQQANRMADNTAVLRSQVENQRMSVSAVSLDEEMSNLLKFQHAYNAAARSLTAIDELIDRVINNMGLVGR